MEPAAIMPVSLAVLDILNGLLEGEQGSVFRFLGNGAPYVSRASAALRKPLQHGIDVNARFALELALLIEDLGGNPSPRVIKLEEQYLAYLSASFLLPKLIGNKQSTVRRYENALKAIGETEARITEMLEAHLDEHRRQLQMLMALSHGPH